MSTSTSMSTTRTQILCLPRRRVEAALGGAFEGFAAPTGAALQVLLGDLLHGGDAVFLPRTPELEADEAQVQVIAYVLVFNHRGEILSYRRSPAGSEARLRGSRTIGFGGHVERADAVALHGRVNLKATVRRAAQRELEETGIAGAALEPIGVVADQSDTVSRVHLGVVFAARPARWPATFGAEVADASWARPHNLDPGEHEPWSRRILESFRAGVPILA